MKFRYTVTVDVDFIHSDEYDTLPEDIAHHIADAVLSWGGQRNPSDVLFPSNFRRVDVRGRGHHIFVDNTD